MKRAVTVPKTPDTSRSEQPVRGTIRARELQTIIRQKLERAIADPGHLRDIFSRMDHDGSGVLTFDDFGQACDSMGIMMPPDQKARLFERFDSGSQGYITYADFVNRIALVPHDIVDVPHPHAPEARCSTPQVLDEVRDRLKEQVMSRKCRIEELFKWFDVNSSKKISYGAFRDKIRSLKLPVQDIHIKQIWKQFGVDDKNGINFKDFVSKLLNFQLEGAPINASTLHGIPDSTPLPDGYERGTPTFDLGNSRPATSGPTGPSKRRSDRRTARAQGGGLSLTPFDARPLSAAGRGVVIGRQGKEMSRKRAGSHGDIFAEASSQLKTLQQKGKVRGDHSFRSDPLLPSSRLGSYRSQSALSQGCRHWDTSATISV